MEMLANRLDTSTRARLQFTTWLCPHYGVDFMFGGLLLYLYAANK